MASAGYGVWLRGKNNDGTIRRPQTLQFAKWKSIDAPPLFNKWMDIVIHVNTSSPNSEKGFVEFWVDGKYHGRRDSHIHGRNMDDVPEGWQMNYKVGQYFCTDSTNIFYLDEFRAGDERSSYAEVAPGKGSLPSAVPPSIPTGLQATKQ